MRDVVVSNYVTVDGYFEGPGKELDWFVWDEDMAAYSRELFATFDTILFGRATYELMAAYWPEAKDEDPVIKTGMNEFPKVVFSKTLDRTEWRNSRLVKGDAGEEIERLKRLPGKDMVIFGSGRLVSSLTNRGLIDEYRLVVNPIILGSGTPHFRGVERRIGLKLTGTKPFRSGNVLLTYRPAK